MQIILLCRHKRRSCLAPLNTLSFRLGSNYLPKIIRLALNPGLAPAPLIRNVNRVIGFLRFIGIFNAAIWLGGAVFFTFAVGQVPFSQAMKDLLGPKNAPYYSGAIAQLFISKYFALHIICGLVAILHHAAERLYLGRPPRPRTFGLLVGLLCCGLLGGFWFQPKLKHLHAMKYAPNLSQPVKDAAARSFKIWHATSQVLNLFVLGGLSLYVWRVNNPSDPTRTISHMHVRG